MSNTALLQMLDLLALPERLILPCAPGTAADFLKARSEWEQAGFVEPDFDGSLRPKPRFARMLYNLTHVQSVLRLCCGQRTVLYVRGPVDLLRMSTEDGGSWKLALCPLAQVRRRCGTQWLTAEAGELTTQRSGEPSPLHTDLAQTQPASEERLGVLREHLFRFYPDAVNPAQRTKGGSEDAAVS